MTAKMLDMDPAGLLTRLNAHHVPGALSAEPLLRVSATGVKLIYAPVSSIKSLPLHYVRRSTQSTCQPCWLLLMDFPLPSTTDPAMLEVIQHNPLSVRELQVLTLIAQGNSNKEIAERLFISLHTVKTHVRRIYIKLDVQRRTQAVATAKRLGLVLGE